jgi:hypothetical protein
VVSEQLPGGGEIFLDHVAHFVPALAPAAATLEACGFRLTPFTNQINEVEGRPVPAGTGNRCAMLRCGYVELLAATADTSLAWQLRQSLARHVGVHLAAFSSADAASEYRRLAAAGFPVQPLVHMRRRVGGENGEAEARFTIARVAPGTMPEGRVQFLTHHTEHLVWRPADLDHPNGAQALLALWVAATDPNEPAARFSRFTGRPPRRDGETVAIALERGALRFATPEFLEREFGVSPGPPPPYLAAYEIAVADLRRLARRLEQAGIKPRRVGANRLAAALAPAVGGTILFRAPPG